MNLSLGLGEESAWLDPEWVEALEESTQSLEEGDTVTAEALARSERRALSRLRKMTPSRIKTVLLGRNPSEKLGETFTEPCTDTLCAARRMPPT